jgi:hypothetical protein
VVASRDLFLWFKPDCSNRIGAMSLANVTGCAGSVRLAAAAVVETTVPRITTAAATI